MFRPRNSLTSSTLILALLSAPAMAQDTPTEDAGAPVVVAYQTYAAARTALVSGIAGGGDLQSQLAAAQQARMELEEACATAQTPELNVCVETFIAADMRVDGDTSPLPEIPAMNEEPVSEAPSSDETSEEAPADVTSEAEVPADVLPAAEDPVVENQADEAPASDVEEAVETEVAAESEAAPVTDGEMSTEMNAETTAEPGAEAQGNSVNDGAEVQVAYAAYADARAMLETTRENDGDVAIAVENVNLALDGVMQACEQIGTPDLATCLELYVSSDARLQDDMAPIDMPSTDSEEVAVEEDTAPPAPEDVAPVLDSQKEAESLGEAETVVETDTSGEQTEQPADTEPAPTTDEEAQADAQPQNIRGSDEEVGEEISQDMGREETRQQNAPENAEVVQKNEFRIVFKFGEQLLVRNQDNSRMGYDSKDTRYERLSNNRYRETIFRANGSQLVTIYNRNSDILQRSVIEPDGTEYFLLYTPEDRYDDVLNWTDPAEDLPPLNLIIPASEYVLDARSSDEDRIYEFLSRPPVERTKRLYSVSEVKRSARLRDVMRRLEIGDLTFQTNSASLSAQQYGSLSNVANAMAQLLEENPAELFLIEGHTDAVGSDLANLDLSDRRAETVAIVLTQTFGIPPENLATQGYGERYLAIRTQAAERLNRRVTIKRITPLVSPGVASTR